MTLVVKRWTRYGKNGLYVETDTGEKVGFLDLLTGEATVQRADLTVAFHEAVSASRALRPAPRSPSLRLSPLSPPQNP